MQRLPQLTRNVKITSKPALSSLAKLNTRLHEIEKIFGNTGRVMVRYSGTETLARITLEGPDLPQLRTLAAELESILLSEIAALEKEA